MSSVGELYSGVQERDQSNLISELRELPKDLMAFGAVTTTKQTLLNRAGEQLIADQFHHAYASLCDFAQQRLNVDFIDPDDFLVNDKNGQLRPISSKLDAVAAELFPDRAKSSSR